MVVASVQLTSLRRHKGTSSEAGGDAWVASPEPESRQSAPSPVAGELPRAPTRNTNTG